MTLDLERVAGPNLDDDALAVHDALNRLAVADPRAPARRSAASGARGCIGRGAPFVTSVSRNKF
jgi:hypothetical protein